MKKAFLLFCGLVLSMSTYAAEKSLDEIINDKFASVTEVVASIVFYSFKFNIGGNEVSIPFIIIWLLAGAIFFTIYFRFVNIRLFTTAINIVRGKYDDKSSHGEVSHFQALTAALSGTVGLGNIAGVAAAISLGGPGATFWMILAGLLGMSSKFVECTLGVRFRTISEDGTVYGGPMHYLSKGLADKGEGLKILGQILAVMFAVLCILGSFGGGNMFQANQAFSQFSGIDGVKGSWIADNGWFFGLIMAALVAVVIIGGIKSIAKVTDKIVPFMVGIYVLAALIIIFANFTKIPEAFGLIFKGAFTPKAGFGGIVGVMIVGIKRAAFSNEAGIGSASIAHSAVRTDYAASEGIVSLLEPFIDTVVVCTMTAIVLIITGSYDNSSGLGGIELTSSAFSTIIPGANYVIMVAAILFAFSTMISWSYYGLQAWSYIFGKSRIAEAIYKVIFCLFVIVGSSASLGAVIDFSDCMILAMCFPNIIGLLFLLPIVKNELNRYLDKIRGREEV